MSESCPAHQFTAPINDYSDAYRLALAFPALSRDPQQGKAQIVSLKRGGKFAAAHVSFCVPHHSTAV